MIDYQGFRNYLERLGFANNGVNTYVTSYLHENKIAILNNFEEYKSLSDEEKLIKFSKEDRSFEEKFNNHHSYSKQSTFSDVQSGARRYALFLQYKSILNTLKKYKENKASFVINDAYWFFNIFDDEELYPVKAICRENLKILNLKSYFTTNDAKGKLNNIFNFKNNKNNLVFIDTKEENENSNKDVNMLNNESQLLNQILYGPPGTGKTYHTIDKALEIIDGEVPKNREEAKERFEALKEAGQIEFVTFHQSYGYEEFVEGIKAKTADRGIEYNVEAGVFKELSTIAQKQYENSKKSTSEIATQLSKKEKISDFLNTALEEEQIFQKTKGGKFKIKDLTQHTIDLYSEDSNYTENSISLDVDEFYKIIDSNIDFKTSRQIAKEVFGISNQRQKDTYYLSLYKEYKKLPDNIIQTNQIESIKLKNYILIIDEINRGNISKIFGELITLIEESKRLGNKEAIEVTLPYSGEKFGVPNNLYILGTMNTADRSIALMDTALRRRFEFEEMMPKPSKLHIIKVADKSIDLVQLLIIINQRIAYLYDRDHTIGHAYFMGIVDKGSLDSVMRNKVIPLLQEYFYDDWEKIRLVLNDGFIERNKQDASKLFDTDYDEYIEEDKYVYSIASDFAFDSYIKIYAKIEQNQEGESHE